MRKAVLIGWLALWAATATAATALPPNELHRLAAYLAFITTTLDPDDPGGIEYTVNDPCGNCQGSGVLGDGKVEFPCEWEDGKYYCNKGKIAKRSDGDAMDYEDIGDAMCESVCDCGNCDGTCGGGCCENCKCGTPERDELFEAIEDAPAHYNESYVEKLEYDLTSALQELETLKADQTCQQDEEPQPEEIQEETPEPEESSSKTVTVYRMKGSTWNWEGRSNPSTEFMRQHLKEEHGIDASLMDRKAMQAIHDNCHNYGDDKAFGFPTEYNSSMTSNCPSGTCPLPGSSGSGSCPTCPGGSSSRSYSRGFFGRWR